MYGGAQTESKHAYNKQLVRDNNKETDLHINDKVRPQHKSGFVPE